MKLNYQTYADFFHQMSLLLRSGIRLDDACVILADGESDAFYRDILNAFASRLEKGDSLHEALAQSSCFPEHVLALIRTAEAVGRTEEVLSSLGDNYESKYRLQRALIRTITYPLVLLLIMLVIVVILLCRVFPIFEEVYESLGGTMTGFASVLLKLGDKIGSILPYFGIGCGILLVLFSIVMAIPWLRDKIKYMFLRYFGDIGLFRKFNNAFFIQNLTLIFASGIPVAEGLHWIDLFTKERHSFYKRYEKVRERLQNGEDLSLVLKENDFLDTASFRMLSVAFRTGNADTVLDQISHRISDEAEEALEESISQVETGMVVAMSFLVGTILFSAMIPLINIMKAFG